MNGQLVLCACNILHLLVHDKDTVTSGLRLLDCLGKNIVQITAIERPRHEGGRVGITGVMFFQPSQEIAILPFIGTHRGGTHIQKMCRVLRAIGLP